LIATVEVKLVVSELVLKKAIPQKVALEFGVIAGSRDCSVSSSFSMLHPL
jgi:hypothetical protein